MRTIRYSDTRPAAFARAVKMLAADGSNPHAALMLAEKKFGADADETAILRKAAVGAARTTSDGWGSDLAETVGNAFFGVAAETSVHGRMTQVPSNVRLTGVGAGATAGFVAEGAHAPILQMSLNDGALTPTLVVATIVVSRELARLSDPRADEVFQRELEKATRNAIDAAMLSDAAASASTPGGIFEGVTPVTATSDPSADIRDLVDSFDGDLESAIFVGNPKTLASLAGAARPLAGIRNGEIFNAPAIASRNCPAGTLALIDTSGVAVAAEGFDLSVSTEASAIMADNPGSTGAQVSFFQSGLVGIRLTRNINWAAIRPGSVALITGAAW